MSVIIDIIREEHERLIALIQLYDDKIKGYIKGSLKAKNNRGHIYFYLQYRSGNKIMSDYVGKKDSAKYIDCLAQINERKDYEMMRAEAKEDLKELKKLYKKSWRAGENLKARKTRRIQPRYKQTDKDGSLGDGR